jgi:hypothetical protein
MRAALFAVALAAFACVVTADDPTVTLPGVSDLSKLSSWGQLTPGSSSRRLRHGARPAAQAADALDAELTHTSAFRTRSGRQETPHVLQLSCLLSVLQHLTTLTRL